VVTHTRRRVSLAGGGLPEQIETIKYIMDCFATLIICTNDACNGEILKKLVTKTR